MATNVTWLGSTDTSWDTASNWSDGAVPVSGDSVSIPAGAPSIDDGLNQSAVALETFTIEEGYQGTIGDPTVRNNPTFLQVDPNQFQCHGSCTAYLNFENLTPINAFVTTTGGSASGGYGLHIMGEEVNWDIRGGSVAISPFLHTPGTVGNLQVTGGSVLIGTSSTYAGVLQMSAGRLTMRSASATVPAMTQHGGTIDIDAWGAATAITQYGGTINAVHWTVSPSIITTHGGHINLEGGVTRTLTALKLAGGSFLWNTTMVGITTLSVDTGQWQIGSTRR